MARTKSFSKGDIKPIWYVVDLEGLVAGRISTVIADVLRGKHRATFTPHQDIGDCVVAINADKVVFTGNKEDGKIYYRHTEFSGGIRKRTVGEQRALDASKMIYSSVKGMLPNNYLSDKLITKLKVYNGSEHPHVAQQVQELKHNLKKREK